jgi:VanZ family protein
MKKLFVPSLIAFIISQGAMFYLAFIDLSDYAVGNYFSGAIAHFMAFFITSFLIVFTLHQTSIKNKYFYAFLYCVIIAILIELIQQTLPHREFSRWDMLFGVLGSITFILFAKIIKATSHFNPLHPPK